jgi:regulator of cell morphogenesis and NO signaling
LSSLNETVTVGEIVAQDFRAGALFQKFGIDFCCGGKRSVSDACRSAEVAPEIVLDALKRLSAEAPSPDRASDWPLDRLLEHIVVTHHAYIRSAGPTIVTYLGKLVSVHGSRHPELQRIAQTFSRLHRELLTHMMKEEHVLFPYIDELTRRSDPPKGASPFGTVENPIRMMEREHEDAGKELRLIRELANDFTPPAESCTTYRVCFEELRRFEQDLFRHVHLENNILFPKTVALERRVCFGPAGVEV